MQKFSAYLFLDGEVHGSGSAGFGLDLAVVAAVVQQLENDVALISDGEVQSTRPSEGSARVRWWRLVVAG